MSFTFGSLFSGIGGMDLGLERAGMKCAWQVEIDDYATRVLAKHWPAVPRFRDVRECGKHNLSAVDLIVGGFPCQDISNAGKRAGIEGERSGLWSEYYRIICELRPRYVLVENVAALLGRGMGRVLGDLASLGYDAEWSVLSACSMGAPHSRERVFLVAYPTGVGFIWQWPTGGGHGGTKSTRGKATIGNSHGIVAQMGHPISAGSWKSSRYSQSKILGVADGLSRELDELHGLGNAVVPEVAQWIGERILEASL